MFDLPQKYIHILKEMIDRYLPNSEVWVYGSRIKGENHESSDLDLVIRKTESSLDQFIEFKEALKESDIPILIDVVDWKFIPDSFKQEILKNHFVL